MAEITVDQTRKTLTCDLQYILDAVLAKAAADGIDIALPTGGEAADAFSFGPFPAWIGSDANDPNVTTDLTVTVDLVCVDSSLA